jgi:hypothetical protein
MKIRNASMLVLGAAAILIADAAVARAQDTTHTRRRPTSERRIPVTKEAPGEVILRVDTVTIYRTDTLSIMRVDTVHRTMTRVDTVMRTPPIRLNGGWFLGLGGGTTMLSGSLRTVNQAGFSGQAQLGYLGAKNLLGGRIDVNYAGLADASDYANLGDRPQVWNVNFDGIVQLPFINRIFGRTPRFNIYGLGGGTWTSAKDLRVSLETGVLGGVGPQNAALFDDPNLDGGWNSRWGWNAGGGISFHWASNEVFVESRALSIYPRQADAGRQIPLVFGFNWY